jgi:hypothetical protein
MRDYTSRMIEPTPPNDEWRVDALDPETQESLYLEEGMHIKWRDHKKWMHGMIVHHLGDGIWTVKLVVTIK